MLEIPQKMYNTQNISFSRGVFPTTIRFKNKNKKYEKDGKIEEENKISQ